MAWLPISSTATSNRTANISKLNGDNQLYLLQDGQFDIAITDDTAIDYAILKIEVIPEPTMATILYGGLLGLIRRRQHNKY